MMHVLAIEAPEGAVLEFSLLFAVILLGPVVIAKAKLPGIIGLLLGGYAIGPYGLGWIGAGNQTIPELGQLGLLYLMFVAGLELDLGLLREYRRVAITFGITTFILPFVAGVAVGISQGWTIPASLLLGSLLASHTLILYPTVRDAGLGANPAVASAVGASVLTDTLALVVLAGVAGTATGDGSTAAVLGGVAFGLVVLVVVGFVVLPRVALAALHLWGGDRAARYLVSIVGFLAMAMLAEVFGIEGIVGAFFAGLALNRLVPNEGPSMGRIEFFGSAVFIPVFLVSVGLLLDPSVMFTTETLGIAGLLCLACIGGKAAAALLARPMLKFTAGEAGVVFVLTTPQAAATLAATLVGFDIGLFGTSVVNAVLVLILVSILASTLLAPRFIERLPQPEAPTRLLGEEILVAAGADGPSRAALRLAQSFASADGGMVDVVLVHPEDERPLAATEVRALDRAIFRGSLDGQIRTVVDRTAHEAIGHAALTHDPTMVIIDASSIARDGMWEPLRRHLESIPTLVLFGATTTRPGSIVHLGQPDFAGSTLCAGVAEAFARGGNQDVQHTDLEGFRVPESCAVVVSADWDTAVAPTVPEGSVWVSVMGPTPA